MENQDTDSLITLAGEKRRLITIFLALTEEQAEAIKNENYHLILNTINKKQAVIEQINLLTSNSPGFTPDDDQTLKLIDQETREIMARAITLEDQNIRSLKNRQAKIFEKLKSAKASKLTHSAYRGKNVNMEGILLDKKK